MKKQTLAILLIAVGMLIGAGGCNRDSETALQKEYEQEEKLLYATIAKLIEIDKTRKNKVVYNFSIEDLGMTKGRAIKTFGFPNHVDCTYRKGYLWGTYKSTQWKYRGGLCLYFKNGILISYKIERRKRETHPVG